MANPHFMALDVGLYIEVKHHFFTEYFYMVFSQYLGLICDALAGDVEQQFMRTTFVQMQEYDVQLKKESQTITTENQRENLE